MTRPRPVPWTGRLAFIDKPSCDNRTLLLDYDAGLWTTHMPLPMYALTGGEVISCGFVESVRVRDHPGIDEIPGWREVWGDGVMLADRRTAHLVRRLDEPGGIPCGVSAVADDITYGKGGRALVRNWTLTGLGLYVDDTLRPAWEHTFIQTRDPD